MNADFWRERISNRSDLVARITHLTRGNTDDEAFEVLWKILQDKTIKGSGNEGYIVGGKKAVCFQEVSLYSIAENLIFEDALGGKNRYSRFGLRFNKIGMYRLGARPVIYGKTEELKSALSKNEYWRIVNLDLDSESVVDWSHEREWRLPSDYHFKYSDTEVIVKDDHYYKIFINKCIQDNRLDILMNINGIIPLNTVIS